MIAAGGREPTLHVFLVKERAGRSADSVMAWVFMLVPFVGALRFPVHPFARIVLIEEGYLVIIARIVRDIPRNAVCIVGEKDTILSLIPTHSELIGTPTRSEPVVKLARTASQVFLAKESLCDTSNREEQFKFAISQA